MTLDVGQFVTCETITSGIKFLDGMFIKQMEQSTKRGSASYSNISLNQSQNCTCVFVVTFSMYSPQQTTFLYLPQTLIQSTDQGNQVTM